MTELDVAKSRLNLHSTELIFMKFKYFGKILICFKYMRILTMSCDF